MTTCIEQAPDLTAIRRVHTIRIQGVVIAFLQLALERVRFLRHPHLHPDVQDAGVGLVREQVLSALDRALQAEAIVAPLTRYDAHRMYAAVQAAAEDRADDIRWGLAWTDGLDEPIRTFYRDALTAERPGTAPCADACLCVCAHLCGRHFLGGGRCSASGCDCQAFAEQPTAEQLAQLGGAIAQLDAVCVEIADGDARDAGFAPAHLPEGDTA